MAGVETDLAMFLSAIDLSEAPPDVITVLLGNMSLEQRLTCALVCSQWAKAAAATTHSIVKHGLRDLTGLLQWLEKNGVQIKNLQLHMCREAGMASLPCPQLQDLLLHGFAWDCKLILDSRVWSDIAAATKLTSVSLHWVRTDSQQADVVSGLTALPDLQQLTWRDVQCGEQRGLSDSRLLQQLTKLTGLDLKAVSAEALQHLGSVSKLQHLGLGQPVGSVAAEIPGLQDLTALTSLQLVYPLMTFLVNVSQFTALQQLKLCSATSTALHCLKALTALTKLHVVFLNPDATPLQLPALRSLDLGICLFPDDTTLHISQLSSCTQLRQLTLRGFCLVGPDSLAASSMLQELSLHGCLLSSPEGPAGMEPWQLLFPGPSRLPHLTSLVLRPKLSPVDPPLQQADLERLVACCSGLRLLELCPDRSAWTLTSASAFECLPHLSNLIALRLSTVTDQQCSSLAQLTRLQELQVNNPQELSPAGLRHLARLQQLTRLCFVDAFDSCKASAALQAQLSDASQGCCSALLNKAPPGSPPDVSARLLHACDMAAGGQQQ